jgi:putative membrane protein|tara:strand:- start:900 stop:1631 length:732 start_codon:yes stop_codon:yes gene_type:complete
MTERLRFVIAGFFVGLAELLPGISGSSVAIAFKVYEKFILFLSNLKISNFSFNFKKLNQVFFLDLIIPFFIAMAISVIFASKFILFLYSEYTNGFLIFLSILMCSISFLIAFRLKNEFKLNMNWIIYFLAGAIFAALLNSISLVSNNPSFIGFVLVGFVAFSFFLLPGISGSAILLSIGVYEIIIGSIANIQLEIFMPFAIGCLISLLLMPKIINYLLSKYKLNIMIFFAALIFVSGVLIFPN